MTSRLQIIILVFFLVVTGLSAVAYKHFVLGFPLLATQQEDIWSIEAKIEFEADGSDVTVNFNMLDENPARKVTFAQSIAPDYDFEIKIIKSSKYAQWKAAGLKGPQTLYFREETFFIQKTEFTRNAIPVIDRPIFSGATEKASNRLIKHSQGLSSHRQKIIFILDAVNNKKDEDVALLLQESRGKRRDKVRLAVDLLNLQGIVARSSRGILLDNNKRAQKAQYFVEVFDGRQRTLYDPREVKALSWNEAITLQKANEPLLEIFGGKKSRISFSTLKETRATFNAAVESARREHNALVDFSIYSLPIAEQNTFKLLLLLPLGALVVVILRNLVGIRTSGTFMPILIAMTFLQTSLLAGLALFLVVVGVGLVMRSYLSHLNLLLVPRIASVLVFVIIIYAAVGIASHKLGLIWGSKITFFPMIILAWTIERMSILWDEDGAQEVFIQGAGSLVTASLAYLLMSNTLVADTVFLYPEILLILLSFIISIGSYSGYRLSDLRRFDAMDKF